MRNAMVKIILLNSLVSHNKVIVFRMDFRNVH